MAKQPKGDSHAVRISASALRMVPIEQLVPYANNAKVHGSAQLAKLRASLREFGFVSPILLDENNNILAGHGRVLAAQAENMTKVPCVLVTELTDSQRKAYALADNRIAEDSTWDEAMLKIELESLAEMDFNVSLTGFDFQPSNVTTHFWEGPEPPQPNSEDAVDSEYQAFVDKFKPKRTTDDCYTPELVYRGIRDWAVKRYALAGRPVVRPFYPGGDYEKFEYPKNCVVIDNPPFSILSQICRWYTERGISFFLFAPTLTLFSTCSGAINYLPIGVAVTYENGATVNTSFVTNMGDSKIEMAPDLYAIVSDADAAARAGLRASLPVFKYPAHLLSVGDFDIVRHGASLRFPASSVAFVRALDAQRARGKTIFGGGFLLSEKAAAEKAAAEKAAEKKAAAEKAAAETWELSAREWEVVHSLG